MGDDGGVFGEQRGGLVKDVVFFLEWVSLRDSISLYTFLLDLV